jgi:hypothetical protein
MIDPMSGNPVPPGAMPNEVRDDVPIASSEGEYVLSADVVRYIGLDKIQKMEQQAKEGISRMAEGGRIGGEPPEPPMAPPSQMPNQPPAQMMRKGGMVKRGYNTGGLVQAQQQIPQALSPRPFYGTGGASQGAGDQQNGVVEYVNPDGVVMFIPFHNGRALINIPEGFIPKNVAQASQSEEAQQEESSSWEEPDHLTRGPMTFDELMQQASGVGVERPAIERALMQGLGAMGPAGALAARAVEYFQGQNAERVQTAMREALSTGVAPNGERLTQEQLNGLASQLTRITGSPVEAPRAPSPVSPMSPTSGITQSPLAPSGGLVSASVAGGTGVGGRMSGDFSGTPVHDYTRDLGTQRFSETSQQVSGPAWMAETTASAAPPSRPSWIEENYGYDYTQDISPRYSETSTQYSGPSYMASTPASAAPPSRSSDLTTGYEDTRSGGFTSSQQAGMAPAYNRGGLVSRTGESLPNYKMYKGGLIKRRNK